jgi:hypothetical protein
VTAQRKAHRGDGLIVFPFGEIHALQDEMFGVYFNSSKQLHPAMTNQVYQISIKRRKPIGKTYALVSVQSHFKSDVKQDYVTRGEFFNSCNAGKVGAPKLRHTNNPHYGFRQAALVKMFLIQTEPRLEGYGITGSRSLPLLTDTIN